MLNCSICNNRCSIGELRDYPCEPEDESIMKQKAIRYREGGIGVPTTKFVSPTAIQNGKGSRRRPVDREAYESNYDKIFGNKPPVCELCKGEAESGFCPICD